MLVEEGGEGCSIMVSKGGREVFCCNERGRKTTMEWWVLFSITITRCELGSSGERYENCANLSVKMITNPSNKEDFF